MSKAVFAYLVMVLAEEDVIVFGAGCAGFPRGRGGLADVRREAGRLEAEESARSPEGALS